MLVGAEGPRQAGEAHQGRLPGLGNEGMDCWVPGLAGVPKQVSILLTLVWGGGTFVTTGWAELPGGPLKVQWNGLEK